MTSVSAYSGLDRFLHRIAFGNLGLQVALADFEDKLQPGMATPPPRPVFITSLPRAGTTLLLELVARLPEFATHTYRSMPFVLSPMLWDRVTRGVRRQAQQRPRAHGDGMTVGYDSPEAFEEIAWMAMWRGHFRDDRIVPWAEDENDEAFAAFLGRHMGKVVALAGGDAGRYVSKNNANLARLPLLAREFPDAAIVVPVRHPAAQIASMRRQHARFSRLHGQDRFALDYMNWLGHFEFGAALRPIDFGGWIDRNTDGPDTDASCLRYWIAAYETLLGFDEPAVRIIDYDALCTDPESGLAALAEAIGTGTPGILAARRSAIRPLPATAPCLDADAALIEQALDLHASLSDRAARRVPRFRRQNALAKRRA